MAQIDVIDLTAKTLIRRHPPIAFELVGMTVDPGKIRLYDTAISLPEYRADQVLLVEDTDATKRWAHHMEYLLNRELRGMLAWMVKNLAFNLQLGIPVVLTVVYLNKASYATFPGTCDIIGGDILNTHGFNVVKLWEKREEITSGALGWLAPLLPLCDDNPKESILEEQRELIRGLPFTDDERAELTGMAYTVGTRYFTESVLDRVFREERNLMKETSWVQEWLIEREANGAARGEAQEGRKLVMRVLRKRFGELPLPLQQRIEMADTAWCERMVDRALDASALQDLDLS